MLLLPIHFARGHHRRGERDVHVRSRLSIHLDQPHDQLIATFGLFESHDTNSIITDFQERQILAERACVRWTLKSEQRLIESISLPVSLRLPPIAGVTSEAEKNFVPA